jgi:hypothetical protein
VNDGVVVPWAGLNPGASDFWISSWVRFNTFLGVANRSLITTSPTPPTAGIAIFFGIGANPQLNFRYTGNLGTSLVTTTGLTFPIFNDWLHLVAVKSTANKDNWQLWVNGISPTLVRSGPADAGVITGVTGFNFALLSLIFAGRFDETQFYVGSTPTPAEILYLYNLGNGNRPPITQLPFLRARWTFDTAVPSGPNFTLNDSSGNANHGTSSGISVSPLVVH